MTFTWAGNHNVFVHPSGDCTEDDASSVGASSPAVYTFVSGDIGTKVFACDVGSHCENGQIITFTVSAAAQDGAQSQVTDQNPPAAPPMCPEGFPIDADAWTPDGVGENGDMGGQQCGSIETMLQGHVAGGAPQPPCRARPHLRTAACHVLNPHHFNIVLRTD